MNFPADPFNIAYIGYFFLFQYLDGHFLLSQLVYRQLDLSESSLTEGLFFRKIKKLQKT